MERINNVKILEFLINKAIKNNEYICLFENDHSLVHFYDDFKINNNKYEFTSVSCYYPNDEEEIFVVKIIDIDDFWEEMENDINNTNYDFYIINNKEEVDLIKYKYKNGSSIHSLDQ